VDSLDLLIIIILTCGIVALYHKLTDLDDRLTEIIFFYEGEEYNENEEVVETETPAEVEYNELLREREEKFNDRISQLKAELGSDNAPTQPHTTADILHPDVENLPHDSIIDYETNPPDIEYSK
jgi:predicted nuclease with TOPRIM domain